MPWLLTVLCTHLITIDIANIPAELLTEYAAIGEASGSLLKLDETTEAYRVVSLKRLVLVSKSAPPQPFRLPPPAKIDPSYNPKLHWNVGGCGC